MQLADQPHVSGFAGALRTAREAAGYSQRALARRCGLTAAYVSLMESGKRAPERGTVARLADALGLDPRAADDLLLAAGYAPVGSGVPAEPGPLSALNAVLADPGIAPAQRVTMAALLLAYAQGLAARARAGKPLVADLAAPWQTRVLEVLEEHMDADFASFREGYLSRSFDL